MAMNPQALGAALASAVKAEASKDGASPETIWTAVATEIISHIQTNAQVLPGIALSGSGAMGAVTGATTAPGQIQ